MIDGNNPFMSGLRSGQALGTGMKNAMAGGSPFELAVARVGKGEDATTILQELMQTDPQAAQQFMAYMQQMQGGMVPQSQPQQPQGGMGAMPGASDIGALTNMVNGIKGLF